MTEHQFKLRLPLALKSTLEKLAEKSGRSLSAEIVYRLQLSLQVPSDNRSELRSIVEHLDRQRVAIESAKSELSDTLAEIKLKAVIERRKNERDGR